MEETPKFCLVSYQNCVKPQILKNSEVKLWVSAIHWEELFNLHKPKDKRCQVALLRAFKYAIFKSYQIIIAAENN